jgi:glucosamine-phosphate N-acetyltransferase
MNLQYTTLTELISSKKYSIDKIKEAYFILLAMLTSSPEISNIDFTKSVCKISNIGDIIIAYFFDSEKQNLIIAGSGTIIYEQKLIHGAACVGHIEDIVVHVDYRKHGIARNIIQKLINNGKNNDCYKIILDCKPEIENFYENLGFEKRGTQMANYLFT